MGSYQTALFTGASEDAHSVIAWAQREFSKIQQAINDKILQMNGASNVAPPKPKDCGLALADGVNWNPGSGKGIYAFFNGQWNLLMTATSSIFPLAVNLGGTGKSTAAGARGNSGLGIENAVAYGDANVTIAPTDRVAYLNVALTAPRTWTLPLANTQNPGEILVIATALGTITPTNTISIAAQGSDTTAGLGTLNDNGGTLLIWSDGISKWFGAHFRSYGAAPTANLGVKYDTDGHLLKGATITPTKQYLLAGSGATYTTPAKCTEIIIKFIGGGGGGEGSTGAGAAGGDSIFNGIHAAGGKGGGSAAAGMGGLGGTGGTGAANLRLPGSAGGTANIGTTSVGAPGSPGFNGAGAPLVPNTAVAGNPGGTNTGAGGGGANDGGANRGGGGAGEYVELIITSPAVNYIYTVGAAGTGGTGTAGGAGGSGLIIVEEYY